MIEQAIQEASQTLPINWPLQSFIATNPLWDLHESSFRDALAKIKKFAPIEGSMPLEFYQKHFQNGKILTNDLNQAVREYINTENPHLSNVGADSVEIKTKNITHHLLFAKYSNQKYKNNLLTSEKLSRELNKNITSIIKKKTLEFLMLYFDRGQSSIKFDAADGLYECWNKFVATNNSILREVTGKLSNSKLLSIREIFNDFKVLPEKQADYLSKIYFQLLGWSSLIKWLEQRPDNPYIKRKASLIDIALIWLCYEKSYCHQYQQAFAKIKLKNNIIDSIKPALSQLDELTCLLIWQSAYESAYARKLFAKLTIEKKPNPSIEPGKISAQAVFCIDTRSEGIRRHLEAMQVYETYGFAGFFSFVFEYHNNDCNTLQCPALFPPDSQLHAENTYNWMRVQSNYFLSTLQDTKKSFLAPLALVEIAGLWYAFSMILKSFFSRRFQALKKCLGQDQQEKILDTFISAAQVNKTFNLETRINNSAQFLKTIGLTQNFAPIVLICGHGAQTENNPYQASFDCGACGGNAGYVNAVVVCHILNDNDVRQGLKLQGIDIPDATYFIAGFHNTTRDKISLYEHEIPNSHTEILSKFKQALGAAADQLRQERVQDLPGGFSADNRSIHWAELMPEMGLINNAALIIGPRRLTKNISLERRVFLHCYDPGNDPDGKLLTNILLGPLIVAHWINAQYYFSTTDPAIYGSGNKMLHNVVSGLGVIEGNLSDLKFGLPWQSVAFRDKILHEPLRLLVIIYAPQSRVEALLAQYPTIKALFTGGWVHLKIIEPGE